MGPFSVPVSSFSKSNITDHFVNFYDILIMADDDV